MILPSFDFTSNELARGTTVRPLRGWRAPRSRPISFWRMRNGRVDSFLRSKPSPDRWHHPSETAYGRITAQPKPAGRRRESCFDGELHGEEPWG